MARQGHSQKEDPFELYLRGVFTLAVLGLGWYILENPKKSVTILVAVLVVILLFVVLRIWWRRKHFNDLLEKLRNSPGQEDAVKRFIAISGSEKGRGEDFVSIRGHKFRRYDIEDLTNTLRKNGVPAREKDVSRLLEHYIRERGEGFISGLGSVSKEPQRFASLSPYQFEQLLVRLFQAMGYEARHQGRPGDQGGDVIAVKGGEKLLIQAKRYGDQDPTGNAAVQQAFTAMSIYNCNESMVVTTSYFTPEAREAAKTTRTYLAEKKELQKWLQEYLKEDWF